MEFPIDLIPLEKVRRDLTVAYQPMGAEEALHIEAFRQKGGHILVPRQYGISLCATLGIQFVDETSPGVEINFKTTPKPRQYQVEPLGEVEQAVDTYYDFLFRARTGWGKTIGSLIVASRIGVSTLIVVDQENLKEQWIKSLQEHFGFKKEDIGIVQGSKCSYEGKAVTIAMVQTLSKRKYPQELYDYFGLVIVDEVHIIGAPTFHSVLLDFNAAYRFGVSATPKRKDGLQKLLEFNLGKVRVYIEDEHEPSAVYVAEHDTVYSEYANRAAKMGRFINEVAEDGSRNLLLAEAIAYLYDTGRDTLVLSDRIEHLKHLESLCYYLGIPQEEMGVYAGYQLKYGYEKQLKPSRLPPGCTSKTEFTPVELNLISKRTKSAPLDTIKTTARVIFATYGKFSKGVDEPRLSGGVDATPRSTSEQVQGRILRKKDGKRTPIWVTVFDSKSYRSLYALAQRVKDYEKNNASVSFWSIEEGKKTCPDQDIRALALRESDRLKSMRIVTSKDGLNTLLTREQQIRSARKPGTATTARTGRRPALPTDYIRRARPGR